MIQKFIIRQGHPRLLLFFAGWGMDEYPFLTCRPAEHDFMICYDYRTLDFDRSLLESYSDIRVVAWSMGVWAASQVLAEALADTALPLCSSTAINGTPYPIDETRGIPPAIFRGTLEGLDETSLLKFQRRMCGSATAFEAFRQAAPQRSVDGLREELAAILRHYETLSPTRFRWQQACIGGNDRIFPPQNQQAAWENLSVPVRHESRAHYDPELFQLYLEENPELQ